MVDYFSDGGFIKVIPFPYLKLTRKECWYVRFAIIEEVYFYQYPFRVPNKCRSDIKKIILDLISKLQMLD